MLVSPSQAASPWGTVGWRQGCHWAEHVCPLIAFTAITYWCGLCLLWGPLPKQLAFQVTIKKHCVCARAYTCV